MAVSEQKCALLLSVAEKHTTIFWHVKLNFRNMVMSVERVAIFMVLFKRIAPCKQPTFGS